MKNGKKESGGIRIAASASVLVGVREFQLVLESSGFAVNTISGNYVYGADPENAGDMITYESIKVLGYSYASNKS